jgi:anti-sigma factor (TIGR02949 family)
MTMSKHPSCQEMLAGISEYIDGTARQSLCDEIERHIAECPDCRVVVDTMKKTITLYRQQEKSYQMPSDARQRLYRRLQLDDLVDD